MVGVKCGLEQIRKCKLGFGYVIYFFSLKNRVVKTSHQYIGYSISSNLKKIFNYFIPYKKNKRSLYLLVGPPGLEPGTKGL